MQSQQYHIRLSKVIGVIVYAQSSHRTYTGTPEELEAIYKKVQLENALFGWWSIIGFFWNILALIRNAKAHKLLLSIIAQND